MLRIYTTVIEVLRGLRPVIDDIEKHDRDSTTEISRGSYGELARVSRSTCKRVAGHTEARGSSDIAVLSGRRARRGLVSMWLWPWVTCEESMKGYLIDSITYARCS